MSHILENERNRAWLCCMTKFERIKKMLTIQITFSLCNSTKTLRWGKNRAQPGIEPGSLASKASILPLKHWTLYSIIELTLLVCERETRRHLRCMNTTSENPCILHASTLNTKNKVLRKMISGEFTGMIDQQSSPGQLCTDCWTYRNLSY
jgi:hypothetical protein